MEFWPVLYTYLHSVSSSSRRWVSNLPPWSSRPYSHSCGAAMLIRNCLSFCCACNVSRSTAKLSRSFFCRSCFIFNASRSSSTSVTVALCLPFFGVCWPVSGRPPRLADDEDVEVSSPNRPASSSDLAMRACSRRASRSRCVSTRLSSAWISGVILANNAACADESVVSGRSSKCWKEKLGGCGKKWERGYVFHVIFD